jgi:hypothetical protein
MIIIEGIKMIPRELIKILPGIFLTDDGSMALLSLRIQIVSMNKYTPLLARTSL